MNIVISTIFKVIRPDFCILNENLYPGSLCAVPCHGTLAASFYQFLDHKSTVVLVAFVSPVQVEGINSS